MSRLQNLRDRHREGRCVIVANGPSLNKMDLSSLKNETVIGLNKIFLGFEKFRFYPRYYVAINEKVIEQEATRIKAMTCVKFISQRSAKRVPENSLTYHIDTMNPSARFCKDIQKGVHEGWTVTYAALQIAYYLGFSEVVLIGLDHRYEFSGAANAAAKIEGPDLNHFSEAYFGFGQSWDNPDLANSEESYRIARAEYEKAGRCIVDATLGGACKIFEKADYRQLFGVKTA